MKLLKLLLASAAFIILLYSCRKERSLEGGTIMEPTPTDWQFQEASLFYLGAMDSAFIQSDSISKTITMSGSDTSGTGQIFLGITGTDLVKGNYDNAHVAFQYLQNEAIIYQNAPGQTEDFSITITSIDSLNIEGTFSGTVEDSLGNNKTITNGRFKAPISRVVLPTTPTGTGRLTVWTKELCPGSASLQILVGGQTGFISTPSAQAPECGAAENTSFMLAAGSYTVTAVCGTDSVKYTVNIGDNTCNNLQIDFGNAPLPGDYLPLNINSSWDYQDLAGSATNKIIASDSEQVDGTGPFYTALNDELGNKRLYRKDGSTYYQYVKLDFDNNITDPPTLEIVILHDDYPVDQSWSTPNIPVTVQGINIQVKLVSVIKTRDFTQDFFGITYKNLIEVETTLQISLDGGATFNDSGTSFSTIFAKGIGIIYYQDLSTDTQWGLTNYALGN